MAKLCSTILFNQECSVIHDRVNIRKIEPMTENDYIASGCTALLDAVGGAVHHIGNVHKYARRRMFRSTLFCDTTDGLENASHRYSIDKVKKMIEHEQNKYGWEFLFLGANIDAVETAGTFGIHKDHAVNYHSDSQGTALNYEAVGQAIASVRCGAPIQENWKQVLKQIIKNAKGKAAGAEPVSRHSLNTPGKIHTAPVQIPIHKL